MTIRFTPIVALGLGFLVVIDVSLAAVTLHQTVSDPPTAMKPSGWSPNLSLAGKDGLNHQPLAQYSEILTRPIFFKTRQPYVPPPPTPPRAVPPKSSTQSPRIVPNVVLGGVVIDRNERKAYLFTKAHPRGTWVRRGEIFQGWTVQSINPTAVQLWQQDQTTTLVLYPQP